MPTGGGKSLCYVLPALEVGRTLVVSPLIALMQDQVEALQAVGVPASFINSTLGRAEQNRRFQDFAAGRTALLYVAPERLANPRFLEGLRRHGVHLFVVDEAHCISEWGHDFRPDYLALGVARERLGEPRTLALTATADPVVRRDILARLGIAGPRRRDPDELRPSEPALRRRAPRHGGRAPRLARPLRPRAAAAVGDRLRAHPPCGGGDGGGARRRRGSRPGLPRRDGLRRARHRAAAFHHRRGPRHRRHQRLRARDRQARRALRRPLADAGPPRGLLPGGGPGRARRRAGGVHAALRPPATTPCSDASSIRRTRTARPSAAAGDASSRCRPRRPSARSPRGTSRRRQAGTAGP